MPFINSSKTRTSYDVIVVGSGASGGQAAYTLTMEGLKVLMIEAGRNYDPVRETAMFQTNGQAPLRGVPTPDKQREFYDASVNKKCLVKNCAVEDVELYQFGLQVSQ